jgi:hypothetical protein
MTALPYEEIIPTDTTLDMDETILQFKLANRSNGASTMAVANNALVKVSAN